MPMLWAPANPKIGEREVLAAMLEIDAGLVANRTGVPLISDKGFAGKAFEKELAPYFAGSSFRSLASGDVWVPGRGGRAGGAGCLG